MNCFQLAILQLERENKTKKRNFADLFIKRAIKIRDVAIKNKLDLNNITEDSIKKIEKRK